MTRAAIDLTHAERLARLRRRCAMSGNVDTLARIIEDVAELQWVAPANMHAEIDAFIGRLRTKRERLAPLKAASPPKLRRIVQQPSGVTAGMTIRMRISEWATDADGIRSRVIWNSADGLSPP
jgi:hypothetical protein